jgi:TolB protein
MDQDGSHRVNVTHHAGADYDSALSPDAAKVVFSGQPGGSAQRHLHDAIRRSGAPGAHHEQRRGRPVPTWSPDGSKLAFVRDTNPEPPFSDIFVMAPDGSGQTNLTRTRASELDPAWSPDGGRIAFTRVPFGGGN